MKPLRVKRTMNYQEESPENPKPRKVKTNGMESGVGKRLKTWRKQACLTLMQLSKKIHVSQSTLSELENGKALPSAVTLTNLCQCTNLNICWLLTGHGAMEKTVLNSLDRWSDSEECSQLVKNKDLKDLIEWLIRIYQFGVVEKDFHVKANFMNALANEN